MCETNWNSVKYIYFLSFINWVPGLLCQVCALRTRKTEMLVKKCVLISKCVRMHDSIHECTVIPFYCKHKHLLPFRFVWLLQCVCFHLRMSCNQGRIVYVFPSFVFSVVSLRHFLFARKNIYSINFVPIAVWLMLNAQNNDLNTTNSDTFTPFLCYISVRSSTFTYNAPHDMWKTYRKTQFKNVMLSRLITTTTTTKTTINKNRELLWWPYFWYDDAFHVRAHTSYRMVLFHVANVRRKVFGSRIRNANRLK